MITFIYNGVLKVNVRYIPFVDGEERRVLLTNQLVEVETMNLIALDGTLA